MTKIEEAWARVRAGGPGGGTRIDADHPLDLYGVVDQSDHVGLLLLTDSEPPAGPSLDAIEIQLAPRRDGLWAVSVWLRDNELLPLFAELCDDLIASSTRIAPKAGAAFLMNRLVMWRELLDRGKTGMPMSVLRGLLGELLVLEQCLASWPPADVLAGWVGPLGAPQDFVLPDRRIEVKVSYPTSRAIRITSLDQLDCDEPLTLAVVFLTSLASGPGITVAECVRRVVQRIAGLGPDTARMFQDRLHAVGYMGEGAHEPPFRLDGISSFDVGAEAFPRLRRADVPAGIDRVFYDIDLAALTPFKSSLTP